MHIRGFDVVTIQLHGKASPQQCRRVGDGDRADAVCVDHSPAEKDLPIPRQQRAERLCRRALTERQAPPIGHDRRPSPTPHELMNVGRGFTKPAFFGVVKPRPTPCDLSRKSGPSGVPSDPAWPACHGIVAGSVPGSVVGSLVGLVLGRVVGMWANCGLLRMTAFFTS